MECVKLSGAEIPVLGLGTGGICDGHDNETTASIIKTAISLGITHIDTSENYAGGLAEELVGKAISNFDRKKLFITTKVGRDNLSYNEVISSAKKSLQRLGIDYIDLYLIHAPNPKIPLKETIAAMDFLVEQKLVRFIGVSNFSLGLLKEAQSLAKNKIIANQVEYSLLERNAEDGMLQHCQENNIALIAYTPLAKGLLARPGFNAILDKLSEKYSRTQAQIAVNWLVAHKNVIAIPRTRSVERLRENLGAVGWQLETGDFESLNKEFGNKSLARSMQKLKVMLDYGVRKKYHQIRRSILKPEKTEGVLAGQ